MATEPIDPMQEVRFLSGRLLGDDGLCRLHQRIAGLTPSGVAGQRATLKRLRDHINKSAAPNRNRP